MIIEELRAALLDIRGQELHVTVDDRTLEAARQFLRETRALKRHLKALVEMEGVCDGKRR